MGWAAITDSHLGQVDIDVTTCAVRKAGRIVGSAKLAIHLYPIEAYSVTLSLPPLWSRKRSASSQHKQEVNTDAPPPADGTLAPAPRLGTIDKLQSHQVVTVAQEDKFFFSPKSGYNRSTRRRHRTCSART